MSFCSSGGKWPSPNMACCCGFILVLDVAVFGDSDLFCFPLFGAYFHGLLLLLLTSVYAHFFNVVLTFQYTPFVLLSC